jgi:hypothetical protein
MEDGVCDRKNGEQPPSAVLFQDFQPLAKPARNEYRRNLPHLQVEISPLCQKKYYSKIKRFLIFKAVGK